MSAALAIKSISNKAFDFPVFFGGALAGAEGGGTGAPQWTQAGALSLILNPHSLQLTSATADPLNERFDLAHHDAD
jgi:hypothetical protein